MVNPKRKHNNKGNSYYRPNFWGMMRDVLIQSLNKGQFLIGLVGFIIMILVLKMSQDQVDKMMMELVQMFKSLYYFGWFLAIVCIFGWYLTSKKLRKIQSQEVTRMAKEKNALQELAINKSLSTSNKI